MLHNAAYKQKVAQQQAVKIKVECEITPHLFLVLKHAIDITNGTHVIDFFNQSIARVV